MKSVQSLIRITTFPIIPFLLLTNFSLLLAPQTTSGTTSETGTLSWSPNPEPDLAGYEIFFGDQPGVYNHPNSPISVGNVTNYTFPTGTLLPGITYSFALKAKDDSNNMSGLSQEITGGLPPVITFPTISITSPVNGSTISGIVLVSANASDVSGINHVQFFLDGSPLGAPDTSAPFAINWNTSGLVGTHTLAARARNNTGQETTTPAILVTLGGPTGSPEIAWEATHQNTGASWTNSSWHDRSFRVLLDGAAITRSGTTVQLTLHGRSSGNYTLQRVSLVRRDGTSLDGVDSSFTHVTFGSSWNAGVTVPAGDSITSDPIAFDLLAGQDVFLSFWVPAGSPTVYFPGGSQTTAWTITGNDITSTIDWEGHTISESNSNVYVADTLEVLATNGPTPLPLTVTLAGTGAGTVTSQDSTLSCPGGCSQNYPAGTTVTLTAQAAAGSSFQGWSGAGCSGTGSCLVTLQQATVVSANFVTVSPPPDSTPPTVAIMNPAPGGLVSGIVSIAATASDNIGVAGVRFYVNNSPLGNEDTQAPYTINWDTTGLAPNTYELKALARDVAGNESLSGIVPVTLGGPTGSPEIAWEATHQNTGASWTNSSWHDRSFRVLLDGAAITRSGTTVQLTLHGRSSGNYTLQRVSLVRRDGTSLDGVDSSFTHVTFGSSWNAGVTVPAGDSITSDPIAFDLLAGQDVFLSFWVPAGSPTVYFPGGSQTTAWTITGNDITSTIDWEGHTISESNSNVYVADTLEVLATNGPTPLPLTVTLAGTGAGTVTSQDSTLSCPGGCSQNYPAGTTVTLTAQAAAGSSFQGWSGAGCSGTGSCLVTLQQATVVSANFVTVSPPPDSTPPTVAIMNPAPGGLVSGIVSIAATASDNIGVAGVRFYVNNSPLGNEDTQAPYTINWDTTGLAPNTYELKALARDVAGNESLSGIVPVTLGGPTGSPEIAWEATHQNTGASWTNSSWHDRSFRVLLDGAAITRSGTTVQLTLHGRSSGNYTLQRVSLVRRDGTSLDGVDSSFTHVTFGSSWNAGVTVPAGDSITSDPIAFDLLAGQDVFLSFWVPAGSPTVYFPGGSQTTAWTITGNDITSTIDWEGHTISESNSNVYVADTLEVLATNGPTPLPLTVTLAGTGAGTVTSQDSTLSCPGGCSQNYPAGTTVTLTAQAAAGSSFQGWSGAGCSGTGSCLVTLQQATVVSANFVTVSPPPDSTPPTVAIMNPAPGGLVSGIVSIAATASDNIGVAGVRFYVNNSPLGNEDTQAPYTINWDTTGLAPNTYELKALARDVAGNESLSGIVPVTLGGPTGSPEIAWEATHQNTGASWTNSSWHDRSFRVLLDGAAITRSGTTVQLTLHGRSSGNYTLQRVSLVRRDGTSLDGVDSSFTHVTFGSSWNAGVTVPAGDSITSDPIAFDLLAGQDVFLSFWVPAGSPTVYFPGGSQTTAWTITGNDITSTIDWEGHTISESNSNVYVADTLEVLP
ncbi:Ig-like domain-containing protein [Candidatus Nitronereus thalassa]|uniref:Ig-like domain-containing protein n=1 Tax=Candidatus Nitronereus thalassa TaxID=3020898 RepID=A0ABU3K5G5_9BACT|nr:Ig-like domain-containing protein [Candidatus Nitronereus thalassa]MDT7041602.1 Ig-like domain-containing protein [Candidatus Nitronereus thalassa]